jgi:hypothetical protein
MHDGDDSSQQRRADDDDDDDDDEDGSAEEGMCDDFSALIDAEAAAGHLSAEDEAAAMGAMTADLAQRQVCVIKLVG